MKREQIINKIYDKIRDDLLHALLLYWEEDDANKYPLVDHLSSGNDISTGRDEIDNLIEQIEIEPLIDAILAIPLDVPSDEETEEILWEEISIPLSEQDRLNNTAAYKQYKETFLWMRWMRDEIIKRNK
jgi:hypothetical protein